MFLIPSGARDRYANDAFQERNFEISLSEPYMFL